MSSQHFISHYQVIFFFFSLEKYWRKYQYASRFVHLVRSKSPKITYFSRYAKCILMENSPDADFEVWFYDGKYHLEMIIFPLQFIIQQFFFNSAPQVYKLYIYTNQLHSTVYYMLNMLTKFIYINSLFSNMYISSLSHFSSDLITLRLIVQNHLK